MFLAFQTFIVGLFLGFTFGAIFGYEHFKHNAKSKNMRCSYCGHTFQSNKTMKEVVEDLDKNVLHTSDK